MRTAPLGDQELEVLCFIADHGPMTVRDVARQYGEEHGLARTTILTVMERIRKKGYLSREREDSAFRYEACTGKAEVLRLQVERFVESKLSGSLSPFVAYLVDNPQLTEAEGDALRGLVDAMERGQHDDRD